MKNTNNRFLNKCLSSLVTKQMYRFQLRDYLRETKEKQRSPRDIMDLR